MLYDVIVDEFEFTDVEDTADPNYSTEPVSYTHLDVYKRQALSVAVQNVPLKAAQGKVVEYLSEHALESLLKQPNPVKRTELRNLFFMVLM